MGGGSLGGIFFFWGGEGGRGGADTFTGCLHTMTESSDRHLDTGLGGVDSLCY